MANRRMFSISVIDTDKFLDMPLTTQALYFHFGMHADDDGFIKNPRRLVRSVGAAQDDFKLLIAKGYILPFDSGVIVITDWRQNNRIRKDRYTKTTCADELSMLYVDNNQKYIKIQSGIPTYNQLSTNCRPTGIPSIGKDSIGKDSIGKDSIGKDSIGQDRAEQGNIQSDVLDEFNILWSLYPRKRGKDKALKAYTEARESGETFEAVKEGIENYVLYIHNNRIETKYIKYGSTYFSNQCWNEVYFEGSDILDGIL